MGVLKLAKKWDLISLRDKAVHQSDTQVQLKSPVEKILLARKYGVVKWLNEAYLALASRKEVLTPTEIEHIGWETFGKLMLVREKRLQISETPPKATVKCVQCLTSTPSCAACRGYGYAECYRIEAVVEADSGVSTFNYAEAIESAFG